MQSSIIIKGQIIKVLEKSYEGQKSYSCQFMSADEKRGFIIISVKVEPQFFNNEVKDNSSIEIPIKISSVNGNLYYSAIAPIKLIQK